MIKTKFYIFLTLFITTSICYSQTTIDRKTLRKNNRKLHSKVQFDKNNVTTVDLSKDLKLKIKKIDRLKKLFNLIKGKKNKYHFLIINTKTHTQIQNKRKQKTYGISNSSTGISLPKIGTLIPQIEPYSFYKDKIVIAGQKYLNPLFNPKFYEITETTNGNEVFWEFKPKKKRKYLFVGSLKFVKKSFQLLDFEGYSMKGLNSHIIYSTQKVDSIFYPKQITTYISVGSKNFIQIKTDSKFSKFTSFNDRLKKSSVLINNDKLINIDIKEQKELTLDSTYGKDFKATNLLFNTILNQKKTQQLFDDLTLIADGKIPYKYVNFSMNKFLNFNSYESIRVGIGAETNSKLFSFAQLGSFVGYGIKDKKIKYGFNVDFPIHKKTNTTISTFYKNDLSEPGDVHFKFSRKGFGNEGYRKFGYQYLENEKHLSFDFNTKLIRKTAINIGYNFKEITPLFNYRYAYLPTTTFYQNRFLSTTLRFTPRERFIKTFNNYISLGSKFPTFWFNYENGTVVNQPYQKFNFKVEKKFKFVVYGKFTFNVMAGYINTELPYPFLYNLHGSYRPGTPIINNSFITMRFSEFAADQYVAAHFNHNFGSLTQKRKGFSPELILLHNMAIGSLRNPENHLDFELNSIEKGYFESGFYFKNLITLQNTIGRTGIGLGMMYRYGAYSLSSNNAVIKFSLDFKI